MEINLKDLNEEQKKQVKFAGFKYLVKSLWNGIQHAVMLLVMNTLIAFSMGPVFDNDQFCLFVLTAASFVIVFIRIRAVSKENMSDFEKEVKGIIKK